MQGFPIPLATTAACEVFPPLLVRIPTDEKNAGTSSGFVSSLTKITLEPFSPNSTACFTSNTTMPLAAPGEAAIPLANWTNPFDFGSMVLCKSCSNCSGCSRSKD